MNVGTMVDEVIATLAVSKFCLATVEPRFLLRPSGDLAIVIPGAVSIPGSALVIKLRPDSSPGWKLKSVKFWSFWVEGKSISGAAKVDADEVIEAPFNHSGPSVIDGSLDCLSDFLAWQPTSWSQDSKLSVYEGTASNPDRIVYESGSRQLVMKWFGGVKFAMKIWSADKISIASKEWKTTPTRLPYRRVRVVDASLTASHAALAAFAKVARACLTTAVD